MNRAIFVSFSCMSLLLVSLTTTEVHSHHSSLHYSRHVQDDSIEKLQKIQSAMKQFHDDYQWFPMPDRPLSAPQKPTLSWRVRLLRYLGHESLFQQFRENEPWDSPHNQAVFERNPIPACYVTTGSDSATRKVTYFQVFACSSDAKPGSLFTRGDRRKMAGILDGVDKTLALVESGPAVPWTKPDDLAFDAKAPLPQLLSPSGADFVYGVMVDGTVGRISTTVEDKKLRSIITIDGNENTPVEEAFVTISTRSGSGKPAGPAEPSVPSPPDSVGKLQKIQIAFMNYSNAQGGYFPTPDRIGADRKKPGLSWRVLMLPYLGYDKLFGEFKHDEPWDSPHNQAVVQSHPIPVCYVTPGSDSERTKSTYFQAYVCNKEARPGSFFSAGSRRNLASIKDGADKTLAIVETGPAIPWTKPDDIPFDPTQPVPKLISPTGADYVLGVLVNATVVKMSAALEESKLRALITIDGGEIIALEPTVVPVQTIEDLKKTLPPSKTAQLPEEQNAKPNSDQEIQKHKSLATFFIWMACLAPVIVLVPFVIYWYVKKSKSPPPAKKKKKIKRKETRGDE